METHHVVVQLGVGGIENLVCSLSKEQRLRGWEVTVWTLQQAQAGSALRLAQIQEQELNELGIQVVNLGNSARSIFRNVISMRRRLFNRGRRGPSDSVFHAHSPVASAIVFLSTCHRPIMWLHNSKFEFPDIWMRLLSHVSRDLVTSAPSVQAIWEEKLSRQVSLVPYGLSKHSFIQHRRKVPRARVFLMVARLTNQKRVDRFLRAIHIMKINASPADFECQFLIVGDGPELESLMTLSQKLDIDNYVKFEGSQSDLVKYFLSADIFVLSSDYEGMPIAMLQALAAGLPVVTTPFPASADLINEFQCGFLAKDFSDEALAHALSLAHQDVGLFEVASRASVIAAQMFTIETTVNELEKLGLS